MSEFPPVPTRGSDILTWTKRFHRAVMSIRPQSSASIRVIRSEFGTTYEAVRLNYSVFHPFEVEFVDENSIKVHTGQWTRNGIPVTLTLDGGGVDYKTLGGLADTSTRYYIVVTLSNAGGTSEAGLSPTDLVASITTTEPPGSDKSLQNKETVVAWVDTDGSGEIELVTQRRFEDKDDIGWMGDADTAITTGTAYTRSIQEKPATGVHDLEAELYDFVAGTPFAGTLEDGDYALMRDASRGDSSFGADLVYAPKAEFADWIEDSLEIDTEQITIDPGVPGGSFRHTDLDPNDSVVGNMVGNIDHDFDYWIHGAAYIDCYGQSIGRETTRSSTSATPTLAIDLINSVLLDTTPKKSIDWASRIAYDEVERESINWKLRQAFDGEVTPVKALEWSANPSTGRRLYDEAGVVSICFMGAAAGAGNSRLLFDEAGQKSVTFHQRILFDNGGISRLFWSSAGIGVRGDCDVLASGAGIYKYQGTSGITISDWSGGGILTGTGIIEKLVGDLGPGDKVLVIPA